MASSMVLLCSPAGSHPGAAASTNAASIERRRPRRLSSPHALPGSGEYCLTTNVTCPVMEHHHDHDGARGSGNPPIQADTPLAPWLRYGGQARTADVLPPLFDIRPVDFGMTFGKRFSTFARSISE